MHKQPGSRPALLSSLNVCFIDKPAVEGLNRLSYRRDSSRIQFVCGLIPLFLFFGCPLDSLDRSEQFIVLNISLIVPVRIVTIYFVCKDCLAGNRRDTLTLKHRKVVL